MTIKTTAGSPRRNREKEGEEERVGRRPRRLLKRANRWEKPRSSLPRKLRTVLRERGHPKEGGERSLRTNEAEDYDIGNLEKKPGGSSCPYKKEVLRAQFKAPPGGSLDDDRSRPKNRGEDRMESDPFGARDKRARVGEQRKRSSAADSE